MTRLLHKAFSEAPKLPEQDARAPILLTEIESERLWSDSFARSQDGLAGLAAKALAEHAAGKTKPC